MTTAVNRLAERIRRETLMYRKGEEVEQKNGAIHIYDMPPTPDKGVLIDVHFVNVGFTEAAADPEGFVADVRAACADHGYYADIPSARLAEGPSYIEVGGWLGSQDLALLFMALGEHYGVWKVVTPERLGITGEPADQLAGAGMVLCAGWKDR